MNGSSGERVTEWASGPLSELMSVLSAAALPARIEVFAPGAGGASAGEVHLLAGGLNDAFAGDRRGQDAVLALQQVAGARFAIETRLPDPATGSLANPGPSEGNLAQRPLVEIMRYCEEYVLTCTLEVWRGEEEARISYRRGELVGTVVGGSEAPERLPEVMAWKEGFFEIVLPLPVTPPVLAPSKRNTGSAAVVGDSAGAGPARPVPAERPRRQTDPFITVDAIKRDSPSRPAGTLRPMGESGRKLPPGPPLPGLKARLSATVQAPPAVAAGPRPAPSPVPVPPLLAPPIGKSPLVPTPSATAPAPTLAARALVSPIPKMPAARPLSTATQAAGTRPAHTSAPPAASAGDVAPSSLAAAPSLPVARAPVTAPVAKAPLSVPPLATPTARTPRTAATSPQAPIPSPTAKPSDAQMPARPTSAPPPSTVSASPTFPAAALPSSSSPASPAADAPAADAPAAPVQPAPPSPAKPRSEQAVSTALARQPGVVARPRPAKSPDSPTPSPIRGSSTAAANVAPSALNHISGEISRPTTPVRGTEERPSGVELADDMQDPAAFVNTPPPTQPEIVMAMAQTTPTPISPTTQPKGQPKDDFATRASVRPEDLSVDVDQPRFRPGKRRSRGGAASWPLVIHVLLGVVLGAAIVVAYSAYYGLPLP